MADLSYDIKNSVMGAIGAAMGDGAVLTVYAGSTPYSADAPVPDDCTPLVVFTLGTPSFNTPSGGNLDLNLDTNIVATATSSGIATWARMVPATPPAEGYGALDVTVGDANASTPPDFLLSNISINQGDTLTLAGGSLTTT